MYFWKPAPKAKIWILMGEIIPQSGRNYPPTIRDKCTHERYTQDIKERIHHQKKDNIYREKKKGGIVLQVPPFAQPNHSLTFGRLMC